MTCYTMTNICIGLGKCSFLKLTTTYCLQGNQCLKKLHYPHDWQFRPEVDVHFDGWLAGLIFKLKMSEGDSVGESIHGKPYIVATFLTRIGQIYQSWLDKSTPYSAVRWGGTLLLTAIYMIRVYILQGWYIVTYALGIYHLNLFIAFLSPKVDPSLLDEDEGPALPTKQNEEFRPFIRRLPEFKFWHSATKGIVIAMICTFFDAFNVPVFWPILVMYFIMLFCITMKRQIKHMIKYRYLPFTHGKRTYKEET
uniref:protein RER1 isoform X2 n=1 Tax=Doryrhamphus excisus TaxID=161450 RepID=UPI0025ADE7EA|nr:protein RER1 isoform X2 [Doryrhamphus excisus]